MNKPVTISQVAEIAGVSKTTISRYLNGHFGNMSEATKERIAATIKELNYRPSRQAQALKSKRSYLIGVVVADISNLYSSMLLKGIGEILKEAGYQMIIVDSANSPEQEHQLLTQLLDQGVEGIILQPTVKEAAAYQLLVEAKLPVMLVDRQLEPAIWPLITTDNREASAALVKLAAKRHVQRIIVVTEPIKTIMTRIERYEAVKTAAADHEIQLSLIEVELDQLTEIEAELQQAAASPEKTLIFTSNGRTLMAVAELLQKMKLKVPKDLGLTGFDDWRVTALIGPGITSAEQQSELIGQKAAEKMLTWLGGATPDLAETIVPSIIQVRRSI